MPLEICGLFSRSLPQQKTQLLIDCSHLVSVAYLALCGDKAAQKELPFYESSLRIPLLLLPCRHTDSRAALWDSGVDAVITVRIA